MLLAGVTPLGRVIDERRSTSFEGAVTVWILGDGAAWDYAAASLWK
jgi:hypothetical protein